MQIVEGYRPGAVAAIVGHHMNYYAREWGFGLPFEARVATDCARFLQRYDGARDRLWLVIKNAGIEGSLVLDHDTAGTDHEGLHLRWFILSDALRGQGAGKALMQKATGFADQTSQGKIWLTTFRGLSAARNLYEEFSFELVSETEGETWGRQVYEQVWIRTGPQSS
jgi:GNAT superfamily N-acetyltransferase